jgi:putative Mg2+ transporter-C (MgtC) family protein
MEWPSYFVDFPNTEALSHTIVRLGTAMMFGGAIGFEREAEHKAAGLRTHMLVAIGAALFVLVPLQAGVQLDQLMRVVQGLTMGIGFVGAGTILKLPKEHRIQGLTTAATLWATAAMGASIGLGRLWPATVVLILSLFILHVLPWCESLIRERKGSPSVRPTNRAR